jgi:hypothetical protein
MHLTYCAHVSLFVRMANPSPTQNRRIARPLNITMPEPTRSAVKIACVKAGVSISEWLTLLANRELKIRL